MLGCIYKAFKQINEFKEVIRSLATGPNVGNEKSAKEKKKRHAGAPRVFLCNSCNLNKRSSFFAIF